MSRPAPALRPLQPAVPPAALPGDPPGPGGLPRAPARASARRRQVLVASGVVLAAAILWALALLPGEVRLRELPPDTRAALVRRSLDNLREICGVGGRPRDFCREQATLLLDLSECGPACQSEARRELASDAAVK